jgi:hypothetical protein
MASERETIIAFVFNRSGKKEMTYSEFYLTLSVALNWFTPEVAKVFTKKAVENKLLNEKEDVLTPGFNLSDIKVPLGFYPSKKTFEEKQDKIEIKTKKEEDVLKIIVQKIVEKSSLDEKTIIGQIKQIEQEKNLTTEVAALLVGKEYDIDFDKKTLDKIQI